MECNKNFDYSADCPALSQSELDRAPWNRQEVSAKDFKVTISSSLSKNTDVYTDDYSMEEDQDEEGKYLYPDTSETNWKDAYKNTGHHTPLELIGLFKEFLNKNMPDPIIDAWKYKQYMKLVKECEDWTEDEVEIIEN